MLYYTVTTGNKKYLEDLNYASLLAVKQYLFFGYKLTKTQIIPFHTSVFQLYIFNHNSELHAKALLPQISYLEITFSSFTLIQVLCIQKTVSKSCYT